ncbi:hypothetical protein SPH72_03830 [Rhodobacterales bacterium FZCC0083]|nr:hypothetical protein SPH72_03830 [Rhodobacterales bacterium FZCC0083]
MIAWLKTWLALAGAFVLAMLGVFLSGAAKHKSNQKIRDLKARVSVLQNSKEIEDEVDLMSDGAVSDELGKWMRDRDQQ